MWDKRKLIEDLQNEYVRSKQVYLATDPDREGEAIPGIWLIVGNRSA